MSGKLIEFIRQRDYVLVKELGEGAWGKTVLLQDLDIDEYLVCKKYAPYDESQREKLYQNFVREIKLLHQLFHRNVVRVFNYYLYPQQFSGYILMEFVQGKDVDSYLKDAPEEINEAFAQTIEGFAYLESANVLHRDIRPRNILVRDDGTVKIIDLGFGKKVTAPADFNKSISINWPYPPPADFNEGRYDFATEVYFVGKLFEKIIQDYGIFDFQHWGTLQEMCKHLPAERVASFANIAQRLRAQRLSEVDFTPTELDSYRSFSSCLRDHITKIEAGAKYY
ncbi:MAG: protein kinase family protein [Acidobacteria bacterium]|nr:protein kinase family protein [Acidobacteriota bacterium]